MYTKKLNTRALKVQPACISLYQSFINTTETVVNTLLGEVSTFVPCI